MKKIITYILLIILTLVIIISIVLKYTIQKKETIIKEYIFNYNEKIYVKNLLNIESAEVLNTQTLGDNIYTNETKDKNYIINYKVLDKEPPLIKGSNTITIKKGDNIDLVNKYLCGDNYDKRPNCYIEGEYDINKIGTYDLTYKAEDSSGNISKKDIKLIVKDKLQTNQNTTKSKIYLKDIIKKHKTSSTMIGIDVSSWQGDIDYKKAKQDGVEFVMIRIGYGYNKNNEIIYDSKFKNNILKAKEAGLKIGVYFYSYAKSIEDSVNQANWIINELNGQELDLPIAFDWENWNSFNSYNISFKDLNDIAYAFIDTINSKGYEGTLYSSAYYLENIWYDFNKTWLAHYTTKTDYSKPYQMWQLSSVGVVNGINGNVDINILYLNQ